MVRVLTIILLLFNAASALYGGGALILYPDGSFLELPQSWIAGTVFHSYLIPGLLLFLLLGIGSLTTATLWTFRNPFYPVFTLFLGVAQIVWLLVQVMIIWQANYLHLLYGLLGLFFMLLGWQQRQRQR